jgi:hypothetical protein
LVAGDGDKRHGCRRSDIDAFGDEGKVGGFDDAELGVGGVREGEDAVAFLEAFDVGAEFANDAGYVATEDTGEGYGEAFFGGAGTHLPIDGIDADGLDADENFTGAGGGVGEVFVFELGRPTVFVENNCFHANTSCE